MAAPPGSSSASWCSRNEAVNSRLYRTSSAAGRSEYRRPGGRGVPQGRRRSATAGGGGATKALWPLACHMGASRPLQVWHGDGVIKVKRQVSVTRHGARTNRRVTPLSSLTPASRYTAASAAGRPHAVLVVSVLFASRLHETRTRRQVHLSGLFSCACVGLL